MQKSPDAGLRAFVIWEPVLWSDVTPPLTSVLARVSDGRAAQFWDRGRLVSADLLRAIRTERDERQADTPDDAVVWDCAAIYPPGVRWGEALPAPEYIDCPVVEVIDEVRRRLSSPPASSGR